jgi:hypothetical protein
MVWRCGGDGLMGRSRLKKMVACAVLGNSRLDHGV